MHTDYHSSSNILQYNKREDAQPTVSELQYRWQNEWELWAYVSDHFLFENAHIAYVTKMATVGKLDIAAKRYQEYLRIMTLPGFSSLHSRIAQDWQKKISALATAQFIQLESDGIRNDQPLSLLEVLPRLGKSLWFMAGFLLIWAFIL